jgi:hypothetical protein
MSPLKLKALLVGAVIVRVACHAVHIAEGAAVHQRSCFMDALAAALLLLLLLHSTSHESRAWLESFLSLQVRV